MNKNLSLLLSVVLLLLAGMVGGAVQASVYNAMQKSESLHVLHFAIGTTVSLLSMTLILGAMTMVKK